MKAECIAALIAAGLLLLAMPGVQAQAAKTPFEGTETTVDEGEAEPLISDGILHIRGLVIKTSFAGTLGEDRTLSGPNRIVLNLNLNLATGDGTVFGSFTFDATSDGQTGTFEGTFSGTVTAGVTSVMYVAQGSGDFDGTKMKGSGTETGPGTGVFEHEGVILDPHG